MVARFPGIIPEETPGPQVLGRRAGRAVPALVGMGGIVGREFFQVLGKPLAEGHQVASGPPVDCHQVPGSAAGDVAPAPVGMVGVGSGAVPKGLEGP